MTPEEINQLINESVRNCCEEHHKKDKAKFLAKVVKLALLIEHDADGVEFGKCMNERDE